MAVLPIRKYGDPILRQKAVPLAVFDDRLRQLAADMIETMQAAGGIGLAANQVGCREALCVVEAGLITAGAAPRAFVNPVVAQTAGKLLTMEEGCLSIPEIEAEVERHERIRLRFADLQGNRHEEEFEGLFARVLQHEIDHLNGVFFVDRLSPLKRRMLNKKLQALAEQTRLEMASGRLAGHGPKF
ncbi:MAG: peptide deformylase [candidate division KSB1 bacterium]|nr:peptide deformylase [candidate division KSB1 bacterium]MDZ7273023.1 peptide deformylase [candidate division KSB1 bacterium]MDZ7285126.1 peptide deformylase [candidate division KSB1 bacterium]MDZ7298158.1 peptide deformylase [candidate division KSB1 bacterium]MDZ7306912.1 peptide deformylase [candidate division KSB1 bacterium]